MSEKKHHQFYVDIVGKHQLRVGPHAPIARRPLIEYCVGNNQQIEKLKEENILKGIDPITKLPTRVEYESMIDYFSRQRDALSIVIIDVNNLKITNDVYGHQKGDELLKNVAKIITNNTRQEDFIARIGGDEFIIVKLKDPDYVTKKHQEYERYFIPSEEYPTPLNLADFFQVTEENHVKSRYQKILNSYNQNKNPQDRISFAIGVGCSILDNRELSPEVTNHNFQKTFTSADQKMYQHKKAHKSL